MHTYLVVMRASGIKVQRVNLRDRYNPLPVPLDRMDSVALDFIGPLPEDDGFDCVFDNDGQVRC